jgi:hypothetical protein
VKLRACEELFDGVADGGLSEGRGCLFFLVFVFGSCIPVVLRCFVKVFFRACFFFFIFWKYFVNDRRLRY